jgi:hypothetical protein
MSDVLSVADVPKHSPAAFDQTLDPDHAFPGLHDASTRCNGRHVVSPSISIDTLKPIGQSRSWSNR